MTTLTMRLVKGHFIVSGPDVETMKLRAGARRETGARRIILARRSRRLAPAASERRARNPERRASETGEALGFWSTGAGASKSTRQRLCLVSA